MNRRQELTKRFRKVAWGRLYWKATNRRYYRMFDRDDVCIVINGAARFVYKSMDAFIRELEEAEAYAEVRADREAHGAVDADFD